VKKAVARIQHDDVRVNLLQDRVLDGLNDVLSNTILDSDILKDVILEAGDNNIDHKLGRKILGWFLTKKNAAIDVYDKQGTNAIPEKTLILNSSGGATVDIFVF
jgi:hypothetical protein